MNRKNKIFSNTLLPICINEGCNKNVHVRKYNQDGSIDCRTECYTCHRGGRNRPGVKQHKKDYCENIDGRLEFKCEAVIINGCQLEMDHIDGDRFNNVPENVQTLCKNCHAIKTRTSGDNANNRNKTTLEMLNGSYVSPLESFGV